MFERHFRHYNELGMAREDPTADRWRPEKLIYDYTCYVPLEVWQRAMADLQCKEKRLLTRLRKEAKAEGRAGISQEMIDEYSDWKPDSWIWRQLGQRDCNER